MDFNCAPFKGRKSRDERVIITATHCLIYVGCFDCFNTRIVACFISIMYLLLHRAVSGFNRSGLPITNASSTFMRAQIQIKKLRKVNY